MSWQLRDECERREVETLAAELEVSDVLASVLGWWLLGEAVDWRTGVGGLLILAGIALAVRHPPAPG